MSLTIILPLGFLYYAFSRMLQIWSEWIYCQVDTEVSTPAYSTATCSHLLTQAWGAATVEHWCVFPMAPTQRMTLKCWNGCCNWMLHFSSHMLASSPWHRSSFWHSSHLLMQHLCIKWGSDRDSVILFLMQSLFLHCFIHVTCLQAYFFGAWASGKCQVITRHSVAYPNKACKATGDISHQKQHSRKRNHQSRRHGSVGPLECDGKKKLHASGINKLCNSFTSLVATFLASASCSDTSGSKCLKSWAAKRLLLANLLKLANLKSIINCLMLLSDAISKIVCPTSTSLSQAPSLLSQMKGGTIICTPPVAQSTLANW